MKKEQLVVPAAIAGGFAIIYLIVRKKPSQVVVSSPQPVSVPQVSSGGTNYTINPPAIIDQTRPATIYAYPSASGSGVPAYASADDVAKTARLANAPKTTAELTFDLPKKIPPKTKSAPSTTQSNRGSCGCASACDSCGSTNSRFTDGKGACMSATREKQIPQLLPMLFQSMTVAENLKHMPIDTRTSIPSGEQNSADFYF